MSKAHIFFDLDSTLVDIEGIVELAKLKGKEKIISQLTTDAMEGNIGFHQIALKRHEILKPTAEDLTQLAKIYTDHIIPKIPEIISKLLNTPNLEIYILTGAYTTPTIAVAKTLGIPLKNVYAQLWFKDAKKHIIEDINAPTSQKILVGDGNNDLIAKPAVANFICAAYITKRPRIVNAADYIATTVEELNHIIDDLLNGI